MFGRISPSVLTTYITQLGVSTPDTLGLTLQEGKEPEPLYKLDAALQSPHQGFQVHAQKQPQTHQQAQDQDPQSDHLVLPYTSETDLDPLTPTSDDKTMLAAMRSAFSGGNHGGSSALMQVQMELQQLKAAPILNPHFGMVSK
jgi:hypothetical protein